MPLLSTREVILVKEEVTYNVDPTPVPSLDGMLIGNASWSHEGLRMIERNVVKSTDAVNQHIFGGTLKTVSFDIELKGSGTIDVAPEFGVLFKACSMVETINLGVSVVYEPSSTATDKKSVTVYYYQDRLLHVLTGARGTFTMNFETGAIPMATFTLTGHSAAPVTATLPSPTLDATVPFAVKGNVFTIDGFSAAINSLTVDMGIEVLTPASMSASDGFGEVFNAKRDVNGTFDPQSELVADADFYGDFLAGNALVMTTGVMGTVAGNRLKVDMGGVYYRDAAAGDRDGIRTYDLAYAATETAGDDEIAITFS